MKFACGCLNPRCRNCQRAGLVPFPDDMPAPAGWTPPSDSPAERGAFPPPAVDAPAAPAPSGRCRHLGAEPIGLRDCPSCCGNVRLKEWACALGLGVAGRAVPQRDCGTHCPGYKPED